MAAALTMRRWGYRLAYRGLQVFWFVARPSKRGVKCLLTHGDEILLVRHTYGRRAWDLPGGAMKRHELPVVTARREMAEELGVHDAAWRELGEVQGRVDRRHDTIYCFTAELASTALTIDPVELAGADWFPRAALPADLGPYVVPVVSRAGEWEPPAPAPDAPGARPPS